MKLSPFELKFLLHYYVRAVGDAPGLATPIGPRTAQAMVNLGLLKMNVSEPWNVTPVPQFFKTDLLDAFINMVLSTPLPKQVFIDPRTKEEVPPQFAAETVNEARVRRRVGECTRLHDCYWPLESCNGFPRP